MALTRNQIRNIATDAVNLRTELMDLNTEYAVANQWVAGAMLGILMYETDPPGEQYERDHRGEEGKQPPDIPDAGYPQHPVRYSDTPLG
jgi:hypothetical protein